ARPQGGLRSVPLYRMRTSLHREALESYAWPQSGSRSESSVIRPEVSGRPLMTAGQPHALAPAGISRLTSDKAPIPALPPMFTPIWMTAPGPMYTPLPMFVGFTSIASRPNDVDQFTVSCV